MPTNLAIQQDIFAANRATGTIALSVKQLDGRTRRSHVHEDGSLRVRFPNASPEALEAVFVNTGGGMTGGDRFTIDLAPEAGTSLVAGTAAAEKVYRSIGPDTEMAVTLSVADGARLFWLPQETILFDQARLSRSIDVDLAPGASLLMAEAVVFGRAAMGESVRDGLFADRWRLRVGGRLVHAEAARLDGDIAAKLARRASASGGVALATLALLPGGDAHVEAVRAVADSCAGDIGISSWNNVTVARFCARTGDIVRHDLARVLRALDQDVPKLWIN